MVARFELSSEVNQYFVDIPVYIQRRYCTFSNSLFKCEILIFAKQRVFFSQLAILYGMLSIIADIIFDALCLCQNTCLCNGVDAKQLEGYTRCMI